LQVRHPCNSAELRQSTSDCGADDAGARVKVVGFGMVERKYLIIFHGLGKGICCPHTEREFFVDNLLVRSSRGSHENAVQ
jgi:hypothetical protein